MSLHPQVRRHVLNPYFWYRVFQRRERWLNCERCGFKHECWPYGVSVRSNYKALEESGLGPQPKFVRGPEAAVVCEPCCMWMREAYGDMPVVPR